MDLFDKLIAKIPAKPVIKPISEIEESDSDQDLAYEVEEDEDIEILEDNSQMVNDDSQMVIDDSQLLDNGSQIDNNGSQIVNKDSQSKNSEMEHQIKDKDSPDLEIVSDSTISGTYVKLIQITEDIFYLPTSQLKRN